MCFVLFVFDVLCGVDVCYACAYFLVHSNAFASCCLRLVLYSLAISGTSGSSGLGSLKSEQMDKRTLLIVSAGDQLSFSMSKQMPPLLLMLQ